MGKTIAVLGGGNGAHSLAADLALRGHKVRMFYRHRRYKNVFETGRIRAIGAIEGEAKLELVTDDLAAAVEGADYVCLVAPAYAHATYGEMLRGLLTPKQVLILCPGAFGSLELWRMWGPGPHPVMVETNNLPYGARLTGEGQVTVYNRNVVDVAFMPACAGRDLVDALRADLFPMGGMARDVMACGLSLVNPALHPGPCLLNISNIERPDVDFFLYEHGFTASAAKLAREIDRERCQIARALGYENLKPVADFGNIPEDYTWQQLYMAIHGNITHTVIRGPNDLQNRYLTEDIPYGLVPWSAIGHWAGVRTPRIDAVIAIYSAIYGKSWPEQGLNGEKLGLNGRAPAAFLTFTQDGKGNFS